MLRRILFLFILIAASVPASAQLSILAYVDFASDSPNTVVGYYPTQANPPIVNITRKSIHSVSASSNGQVVGFLVLSGSFSSNVTVNWGYTFSNQVITFAVYSDPNGMTVTTPHTEGTYTATATTTHKINGGSPFTVSKTVTYYVYPYG